MEVGSLEAEAAFGRWAAPTIGSWARTVAGLNKEKAGSLCAAAESDVLACASIARARFTSLTPRMKKLTWRWGMWLQRGAAAVNVAAACSPTAAVTTDVAPAVVVAAHGAPAMEVSVDNDPGMVLAPEVQARLKAVLAGKDPRHHDFFISLYTVMVPALFKSD
ncbi:unnamed protein product [Urochloa humidicola]